ncbi:hypothetical protein MHBO_003912 [Bonamia ostreae]|uniref:Uncharacterized protein n=1 Tax=Bonamia ostreae TaxID=126728 RepID=A0ABV2ARV6_9EUKA
MRPVPCVRRRFPFMLQLSTDENKTFSHLFGGISARGASVVLNVVRPFAATNADDVALVLVLTF